MKNSQGFTLIELLIAVVILGLVMASIGQLLDSGVRDWQLGEVKLEAEQNLRLALEKVRTEAQGALGLDDSTGTTNLVLVFPGNVEVEYRLGSLAEKGPGGLSGYSLQRIYRKYGEETRTTPAITSSQKEIAGYLRQVQFTYHEFDTLGNILDSSAANATYVKLLLEVTLPDGDILNLNTGIALRGKFLTRE